MRTVLLCLALFFSTTIAQDAAWGNRKRGKAWSAETLRLIESAKLFNVVPTDIDSFCPNYRNADQKTRSAFWLMLISAMAKKESGLDTAALYVEPFMNRDSEYVVGRGLLQVAMDDKEANGCRIRDTLDLFHAKVNLACGIHILNKLVRKDLRIGSYRGEKNGRGIARYWSVLRFSNPAQRWIRRTTKNAACCK